jgi:ATP-dependent DNA helicase RecQ
MCIDRPDVRYVVHLDMPDSPEAYYQQIGRAGRDGERSETLLLYGGEDIVRARHFLTQSAAPETEKHAMRNRLESMIALTETDGCRTRSLLRCFGEELPTDCGHCDQCVTPPVTYDGTEDAQKALSAVFRTGQMFGAVHVVSVLRGERTEAAQRHRHDKLPLFGIGANRSAAFWRGVLRQLIAKGALDVDTAGHGGLFLVEEHARPIFRGEVQVSLRKDKDVTTQPRPFRKVPVAQQTGPAPASDAHMGAFEALRQWRATTAKAQGVPAYIIFQDSVLRDIAAAKPTSLPDLARVKGVGTSKLDRYGDEILNALREKPHCSALKAHHQNF